MTRRLPPLLLFLLASVAPAQPGGRYLVITADNFAAIVQPLADWKMKKGVPARVARLSETGSSASQIRSYIRNAYDNWPIRPEFVLLVGGADILPGYTYETDCNYGDMSGDYKMEISVGRFPCETARECSTMVAKTLAYEKPAEGLDSAWFLKATTVVNEDVPPDANYQPDARYVRNCWRDAGYTLCESLSDVQGHASAQVNSAARDGRSFLEHRGACVGHWWTPFDNITPNTWNNGARLPVTVSGSCETVTLEPGASMYGEVFLRAGTPSALGGAVAYFGTTRSAEHVSAQRGAGFRGFTHALFRDEELRIGPATLRARAWVDSLFPGAQIRYTEWNLLGDPELNAWTGMPRRLAVECESVVPMAPQVFSLTVSSGGAPVPGANVCIRMDSVVYGTGVTDAEGAVGIDIVPTHIGPMEVTVTGRNLRPYEASCRVAINDAPYLVEAGTFLDDFSGNHDSVPNPGEQAWLTLSLKNIGAFTAEGVTAVLRAASPGVSVLDSTSVYGGIQPESTASGDPFELRLDTGLVDGASADLAVVARDAEGDSWSIAVDLSVRAGRLAFVCATIVDSAPGGNANGKLGRGESGLIQLGVANAGGASLDGVRVRVECLDSGLVLTDSICSFGSAGAGDTLSGSWCRLGITAGPRMPLTGSVGFLARISGDGGTYQRADTFSFRVPAEQATNRDPTGPDAYGYWCYDDGDTASGQSPEFDWLELAPPGPGEMIPAVSDSDAATRTLRLPFPFRYYGLTDTLVSVCSNGFLALGSTGYKLGNNRGIPDSAGPSNLIAPFWDDLNPDEGRSGYGTAYTFYDAANHAWLVEYSGFAHFSQPTTHETYQAVFCDPQYFPTPTGDGEILFYYNRVSLNSSATVGIEDSSRRRGIQYLFNGSYSAGAAPVVTGRALKFTTSPPRGIDVPWLSLARFRASDTLYGNGNSRAEPGETLEVVATLRNRGGTTAEQVSVTLRALDTDGTALDSVAGFGDISAGGESDNRAEPFLFRMSATPQDSVASVALRVSAGGYATVLYSSVWFYLPIGVEAPDSVRVSRTELAPVRPNPLRHVGVAGFVLARAGPVDVGLFDAAGRRVATLASGRFFAGRHAVRIPASTLGSGVYFCTLSSGGEKYTRKFVVQR